MYRFSLQWMKRIAATVLAVVVFGWTHGLVPIQAAHAQMSMDGCETSCQPTEPTNCVEHCLQLAQEQKTAVVVRSVSEPLLRPQTEVPERFKIQPTKFRPSFLIPPRGPDRHLTVQKRE